LAHSTRGEVLNEAFPSYLANHALFPTRSHAFGDGWSARSVEAADEAGCGSYLLSQAGSVRVLGRPINYWTIVARKWFEMCDWGHLCEVMGIIALITVQLLLPAWRMLMRFGTVSASIPSPPFHERWALFSLDLYSRRV
jgi:hypothetical protein